jgi:hypothetical protein
MAGWEWLTQPAEIYTRWFMVRVVVKAVVLFALVNLAFATLDPLPTLGKISLYNLIIPGRERLPYGEDSAESYNLSLNNLNAMFASHEVSQTKAQGEYRILVMGDSSAWGFLLENADTLAGQINRQKLRSSDGRLIRAYDLGYPTMSLTKDLMLLDHAMQYSPDLVIWLFTLESFLRHEQLDSPLVQNNPEPVRRLIETYMLNLNANDARFVADSFLDQTLVGRRREVADWLRLQLYGVKWGATGIDQAYPEYTLRQSDFDKNITWKTLTEVQPIPEDYLAWEVLAAGVQRAGEIPILLINEPMFISDGKNSDLRYNFFYPRWVYDEYRQQLNQRAHDNGWWYVDLWDIIPPEEFTDSPVHMTPAGTQQFAERIGVIIQAIPLARLCT